MTAHPIEKKIEKEILNLLSTRKEVKAKLDFIDTRIQALEWVENEIKNLDSISKDLDNKACNLCEYWKSTQCPHLSDNKPTCGKFQAIKEHSNGSN